jgi:phosphate transport system substrate-binding protein
MKSIRLAAAGFALALGARAATPDPASWIYQPQRVEVPRGAPYVARDGSIAVVGYNDMAEMLAVLNTLFSATHPGFKFAPVLKGTRTAPPALAAGKSAFAPMGAEFSPQELADYKKATGGEPRLFRVAHCSLNPAALSGPLAVFVPQDNPLTSLTLAEVAEIFSGRNSRGLHPCGLFPWTALGIFMRHAALGADDFGAGFRGFAQSRDVVAAVAADPQAIGFAAAMRSTPGVKMLALAPAPDAEPVAVGEGSIRAGTYPLDRFLLIYARTPLEPWLKEYLRFVLSAEGQDLIARGTLGYLPLNAVELVQERAKLE